MADRFIFNHNGFSLAITFSDSASVLAGISQLPAAIDSAMSAIADRVVLRGSVDIVVEAGSTSTGRLSAASADVFVDGTTFANLNLVTPALLDEARTGMDRNPDRAEIRIILPATRGYLDAFWFDPGGGPVPGNRIDLQSAVMHELLHAMGITGYRDIATGEPGLGYATAFDTLVQTDGTRATFNGAATVDLLGGPLELEFGGRQGIYHLGGDHGDDLINGSRFAMGTRYNLSDIDLAILTDIGWQVYNAGAPSSRDPATWRVDRSGMNVEIGGDGTVIGNAGVQEIHVRDEAGTIWFDPSFNRGGDIIHFSGDAKGWTVMASGSFAVFSDGDTTAHIPVGGAGTTIAFDDSERTLAFDAQTGSAALSGSAIAAEPHTITATIYAPEAGALIIDDGWAFAPSAMTLG